MTIGIVTPLDGEGPLVSSTGESDLPPIGLGSPDNLSHTRAGSRAALREHPRGEAGLEWILVATEAEAQIRARMIAALRHGRARNPYLERYLAANVGASESWSELDQTVLDLLDPVTIQPEAIRRAYGRDSVPALVWDLPSILTGKGEVGD